MMFYIPPGKKELADLKPVIEAHGGRLCDFHECFTYQIETMLEPLSPNLYFPGDVYSAKWLVDSVKERTLLPKDNYLSYNNQETKKCKRMGFGKLNVKYTITEAIKVVTLALRNK